MKMTMTMMRFVEFVPTPTPVRSDGWNDGGYVAGVDGWMLAFLLAYLLSCLLCAEYGLVGRWGIG